MRPFGEPRLTHSVCERRIPRCDFAFSARSYERQLFLPSCSLSPPISKNGTTLCRLVREQQTAFIATISMDLFRKSLADYLTAAGEHEVAQLFTEQA